MSTSPPDLAGVEHDWVSVRGFRMHVAQAGAGESLVLLHGWPHNWWLWRGVIPRLAERYRVICPDMRGFGWSDAPASGYEKENLADDILALLDTLGLDRVGLMGHDWGGFVGFLTCLKQPSRISRYVSINIIHPWPRPSVSGLADVWRTWYQQLLMMPGLGPRLVGGGDQRFVRLMIRGSVADRSALRPSDIETYLAPLRERSRAEASSKLYRTFTLHEFPALVAGRYKDRRLHVPTLMLHGTRDPVVRVRMLEGHEAHADDLTIALIDDVGHSPPDERPDLVAERALEFFERPLPVP